MTDTADTSRWPIYADAVVEAGVGAVFALPLQWGTINLGVLDRAHAAAGRPGPLRRVLPHRRPVSITDLADAAPRWPRLAAALADQNSCRSVHALPARLRGKATGAMNLFHHQPGALPATDLTLEQALTDVATIG
jgi:hypothetical protein